MIKMAKQKITDREDERLNEIALEVQIKNGWNSGDLDLFAELELQEKLKAGMSESEVRNFCEKHFPKITI